MVKIKRLLVLILASITSFCFVGCLYVNEKSAEPTAKEMLAIDKAAIIEDEDYRSDDIINVLELRMKDGTVYQFISTDSLQDSSDSFDVMRREDASLFMRTLRIARDDSLEGNDMYLDSDKEENKYGYILRYGAINEYSVLYVSPDLYEILVDKLCDSRESDVIYDSNEADLPTMSDEQREFMKDFSEDIKVKED